MFTGRDAWHLKHGQLTVHRLSVTCDSVHDIGAAVPYKRFVHPQYGYVTFRNEFVCPSWCIAVVQLKASMLNFWSGRHSSLDEGMYGLTESA